MFKQGRLYKHEAFKDVACYVLLVNQKDNNKDTELTISWYNLGQVKGYFINLPAQTFIVPNDKFDAWTDITHRLGDEE